MGEKTTKTVVHALWIGGALGILEVLCLKSFLRHGHEVRLHSYEPLANVPAGVTQCDASLVIPKDQVFRHHQSGSYSMFGNQFRYELLATNEGAYIDCDMLCLKPFPRNEFLLGYEAPGRVNGAVMDLPLDSPLLADLRALRYKADEYWPWEGPRFISWWQRRQARKAGANPLAYRTWGIYGPSAVSYLVKKHKLEALIQPKDVFYPVFHEDVAKLFDPAYQLQDLITPNTVAIHLYNESLKKRHLDIRQAPANSPLGKLLKDYDLK